MYYVLRVMDLSLTIKQCPLGFVNVHKTFYKKAFLGSAFYLYISG